MQLTRQIVETTAAIKVFIIDSVLDYSPFSREIEISGNSFLREIKPILFSGPMVRARIQQLILRFKNSMGDLGYVPDRLKAAHSWSMVEEADSAFYQLFRIIERTAYDDVNEVLSEPDFLNLKKDTRWEKAIDLIATNKRIKEAKYNWQLISTLDTVFADDQEYRLTVRDSINKYSMESPQLKKLNKMIIEIGSINLLKVTTILDSHGWPGPEVIRNHGTTFF